MRGGITYMSKKEIVDYLKTLTIAEIIDLLSNSNLKDAKQNKKIVYTTEEVLQNYPMFSRYTLNKAIKEQKLTFYREGHKMFFEKDLIDKWVQEHTSTFSYKDKYRL